MAADSSPPTEPVECTRCRHRGLRYITAIPKRLDQPSGFAIYKCEACGRMQWEPRPDAR